MLPVWICLAAVAVLLVAEARGVSAVEWLAKPVAALAFIGAALDWGALDSGFGLAILAGLVLSAVGDVLLIPKGRGRWFLYGIGAFLLGHVAYLVAFVQLALAGAGALLALLFMGGFAALSLRWLLPHVGNDFRLPVIVYVAVISLMMVAAAAAVVAGANPLLLVGAVGFAVSDLSVARNRFVAPGFVNRVWGLPLYFGSQLLLAYGIALV